MNVKNRDYKYGIGKKFITNSGYPYIIVDGKDNKRVIQFEDGSRKTVDITNISRGAVSHPKDEKERHGERYTKLWKEWNTMLWRVNPKNKRHHVWYSDKGIGVCEEWHKYTPFRNWALQNGYSDELTIDRIDESKDYCPDNCRWIPLEENISRAGRKQVIRINKKTKETKIFDSIIMANKSIDSKTAIGDMLRKNKHERGEYLWYYMGDYDENKSDI